MGSDSVEAWDSGPGLFEAVWQYRWMVATVAVVAGGVGFAASFLQPILYQAEAELLLDDPRSEGVFDDASQAYIDPTRYVRNQAEFAMSTQVLDETRTLLNSDIPLDELRERVTVTPASELDLMVISASDPSAEGAAALANAVGGAYQNVAARRYEDNAEGASAELQDSIDELQDVIDDTGRRLREQPGNQVMTAELDSAIAQLTELQARARQVAVDASLYGSGVALFERAEIPETPTQPRPLRNGLVAVVLGVMAAAAWSWWRAEHTRSADARQDAAAVLGVPLLGEVPDFHAVGVTGAAPARTSPHSPAGEAYQFLVASLNFGLAAVNGSTVLVTSAGPGDGKTVTALNLALAARRDGRPTLLVDADERMRGLTQLSQVAPEPGLTDLADDDVPFAGCVGNLRVTDEVRLSFVPAGSRLSDPAGFFRTPGFRHALSRIKKAAELVIVDSPPLLAVADTSAIASQVDGIVIVVTRGAPLRQLEDVRERLQFVGTPVIGYVFNRADPRRSRLGDGYGYGEYLERVTEPPTGGNGRSRRRVLSRGRG